MSIIYRIQNKKSGKTYIGQTIQPLRKRHSQHREQARYGRKGKLYDALRKYPKECFEISILFYVFDKKDLDYFEALFIEEYNSYNKGYNQTQGGYHGGYFHSDEARKKIGDSCRGRENTWYHKAVKTRLKNGHGYCKRVVNFEVIDAEGNTYTGVNLTQWCKENKISVSNLWETFYGRRKHTKGYKLLRTFTDHPEKEYTQASGNGRYPEKDSDMIGSAWQHAAVLNQQISPNRKACSIKGVIYDSITSAADSIGVNMKTVRQWIRNKEDCFIV